MVSRAFPVVYASDVERAAWFSELLGFRRHFQLPAESEPGYVGLRSDTSAAELAVTNAHWAMDRYGLPWVMVRGSRCTFMWRIYMGS
jgi:hypothetical protein